MSEKATLVHLPYTPGTGDYKDSVTAGYYGYAIILTMSVLNFIYYGDLWYRRIILGRWNNWGGLLHTTWGVQGVLRPLVNYIIWAVVGFFAAAAVIDSPNMYVLLGQVVSVAGFIYALRTMAIIVTMVMAFIWDDPLSYTDFAVEGETDFFKSQYSWGNEIRIFGANTTGFAEADETADEYYYMIDIQLEAFNILGGAAAYSFFDIGLKIWDPLAKMGISFIPKDMKTFRKALFLKKLKIYERKFSDSDDSKASASSAASAIDEEDDEI
jgi:hypothetical protein